MILLAAETERKLSKNWLQLISHVNTVSALQYLPCVHSCEWYVLVDYWGNCWAGQRQTEGTSKTHWQAQTKISNYLQAKLGERAFRYFHSYYSRSKQTNLINSLSSASYLTTIAISDLWKISIEYSNGRDVQRQLWNTAYSRLNMQWLPQTTIKLVSKALVYLLLFIVKWINKHVYKNEWSLLQIKLMGSQWIKQSHLLITQRGDDLGIL